MSKYHKIQTVYLRDPETKFKTLLEDQWTMPEFGYLADNEWIWTEKVDGTNIRIVFGDTLEFMGRTDDAQLHTGLMKHLHEHFTPDRMRSVFPADDGDTSEIVLYGEGYGAKIQKGGGNYRADQGFILFDVRVGGLWLDRENVEDIAVKLECPVVPIVGRGTLHEAISIVREGLGSRLTDAMDAEGLVMRPAVEMLTRRGKRIITKIKAKDFN